MFGIILSHSHLWTITDAELTHPHIVIFPNPGLHFASVCIRFTNCKQSLLDTKYASYIILCYGMEKHVHSILAKDFQRKKRKTHKPIINKNTHKHRQVTLHTNEKGKAGPWVPSLENWGGRLKSLLWAQLSLHTQCPNLPMTANS